MRICVWDSAQLSRIRDTRIEEINQRLRICVWDSAQVLRIRNTQILKSSNVCTTKTLDSSRITTSVYAITWRVAFYLHKNVCLEHAFSEICNEVSTRCLCDDRMLCGILPGILRDNCWHSSIHERWDPPSCSIFKSIPTAIEANILNDITVFTASWYCVLYIRISMETRCWYSSPSGESSLLSVSMSDQNMWNKIQRPKIMIGKKTIGHVWTQWTSTYFMYIVHYDKHLIGEAQLMLSGKYYKTFVLYKVGLLSRWIYSACLIAAE